MQRINEEKKGLMQLDGLHLMLDCFKCDSTILADKGKIYSFLDALPQKIGMKKLQNPTIVEYAGNDSWDRGGITGFVLIAESHISIHTFPHNGLLTADVYSCKGFDSKEVVSFFREFFKSKKERIQLAERSLEF